VRRTTARRLLCGVATKETPCGCRSSCASHSPARRNGRVVGVMESFATPYPVMFCDGDTVRSAPDSAHAPPLRDQAVYLVATTHKASQFGHWDVHDRGGADAHGLSHSACLGRFPPYLILRVDQESGRSGAVRGWRFADMRISYDGRCTRLARRVRLTVSPPTWGSAL